MKRLILHAMFLISLLASAAWAVDEPKQEAPRAEPSPLSPEQIEKVRALVRTTQTRDAELKTALETKQRALALAYASFELEAERVTTLQEEIVALQRQLLANYHTLHVELRKIVGPDRFAVLIQRINSVLKNPERPKPEADKGTEKASR